LPKVPDRRLASHLQVTGEQKVAALYKFVTISNPAELQEAVRRAGARHNVVGTVLIANEGINGTIAGAPDDLDGFVEFLKSDPRFADLEPKYSLASVAPFYRFKVKLKNEIVTMGVPAVDAANNAGTYVDPQDWNQLISDPDVVVVDSRNDYEVGIGTFEGAVDPATTSFGELPQWLRDREDITPGKKIAMFCTGGIRCEKSTAFLKSEGFDEVFHLKGGILKYLEQVPEEESLWQGECFVFDERVSVLHGLKTGTHQLCRGCRRPISLEDMRSEHYEPGVSCPACVDELTEERRVRLTERQKQVDLANARNERHVGAVYSKDQPRPAATLDVSNSEHPILYSFRRCPYAMRARMALAVSGKTCEMREVVLRDKPEHFREISPKATVPVVLRTDGSVLEESLDVMLWALDDSDPQNWLTPDAGSFDGMLKLIERADTEFKDYLDRYKYPNRYDNVDAEEQRSLGSEFLKDLDQMLGQSAWLYGARPCLADVAIAPFVRQFANHDRAWFDHEPWPNLLRWLESFLESELFTGVMNKYPQWQPGDPATLFPASSATDWRQN